MCQLLSYLVQCTYAKLHLILHELSSYLATLLIFLARCQGASLNESSTTSEYVRASLPSGNLPIALSLWLALTSMCMQWTQTTLIKTRPRLPTRRPEFLIASGMARMPVPMLPFKRWKIVSQLLERRSVE